MFVSLGLDYIVLRDIQEIHIGILFKFCDPWMCFVSSLIGSTINYFSLLDKIPQGFDLYIIF